MPAFVAAARKADRRPHSLHGLPRDEGATGADGKCFLAAAGVSSSRSWSAIGTTRSCPDFGGASMPRQIALRTVMVFALKSTSVPHRSPLISPARRPAKIEREKATRAAS
jgi:hypothetical protein